MIGQNWFFFSLSIWRFISKESLDERNIPMSVISLGIIGKGDVESIRRDTLFPFGVVAGRL